MLAIDHVVWAVGDLDAAAARLQASHGLDSVAGGEHPGLGTRNRLVPLGGPYLELLAGLPLPEGLVGWMVRTTDIDAHARRLGLDVVRMTRQRPDGVELAWRLAGPGFPAGLPSHLPVFIQWESHPHLHPGVGGDWRLEQLEVAARREELDDWLGGCALPVLPVDGPAGVRALHLRAGGRRLRLAPPPHDSGGSTHPPEPPPEPAGDARG